MTARTKLDWKSQSGFQVANDASCLYMRESTGSVIAGFVFSVVFAVPTGVYGVWLLITNPVGGSRVFAGLLLLVSAVFSFVLWSSLRRGRWMIVYDRGGAGTPAEIRFNGGKRLAASRVRSLSTRSVGGSMPKSSVVAELHDGKYEWLGPVGVSTWPVHWGQQAATWMGLPFRSAS